MNKLRLKKKFNVNSLSVYQKSNLIAILICLFFVCTLSVGYAILSQKMDINGEVVVRAIKDIRVSSIGEYSATNGGYEIYNPKYDTNSITTNVNLTNLNSTVTYKVTITNNGTVPMKIKGIVDSVNSNENIVYSLNSVKVNDVIASKTTLSFDITFKYKDGLSVLPEDVKSGLVLSFEFEEYIPEVTSEYASGGMLLDLRGVDAPKNGIWYDRVSSQAMKLSDVVYDSEYKKYTFAGSSYGTLGKAIIPKTGDFTLEVRLTYPEDVSANTDQAVVSQISDTSNDAGRFKVNAKYESSQKRILIFYNDVKLNTNKFLYFTNSAVAKKDYLVQVVRTNGEFKLYLNGVDTGGGSSFNELSTISQGPFKLGKWNTTLQSFHGGIYSVRLYNRALNDEELVKNKETDDAYYKKVINLPPTLKEYAIKFQSNSLFLDNINNYVYRGTAPSNYIKFKGDDTLYRIISFNSDNTMKIIDTKSKFNLPFDESGTHNSSTDTYCDMSSSIADSSINQFYGCNAWNSVDSISNGTITGNVTKDSSSNTYLNTTYYNSMSAVAKSKVVTHDFYTGFAKAGMTRETLNTSSLQNTWNGKIGLLTLADVFNASTTSYTVSETNTTISNYLISLTGAKDVYWTMTPSNTNTFDVYTYLRGTLAGKRRSSRYKQADSSITYTMYAVPSFYVKSNVSYTGIGTKDEPFEI